MHTAHQGRVPLHSLEVNGEVVLCRQDGAEEEEQSRRTGPDDFLLKHRHRNHGRVSLVVLPDEKEDKSDGAADKEADDHGAVPRM